MNRLATALLAAACSATAKPPLSGLSCNGPVSCAREQLLEADLALQHAVQERGPARAFAEVLLPDARYLSEGQGAIVGRQQIERLLRSDAPFAWTLARGDVSVAGTLGYTFGWVASSNDARGHCAAVWKRQGGEWKLAVFLRKPARAQRVAPPAWFGPFRGEREAPAAAAQTVSGADLTFAALAQATGMQQAFTAYAAQDAVQLAGTMVFGRDAIHGLLERAPLLRWRPVAEEDGGDLGYTVGAWETGSRRGNYLTVWRLQSDGSWRFVLDAGVSG